jgi:hypothetical protein
VIAVSNFLSSPDFGPVHTGTIGAAQSDAAVAEGRARDIIPISMPNALEATG